MSEKIEVLGLLPGELEKILASMGHEYYRGRQIFKWVYQRGAHSFDDMSDISLSLRTELADRFTLNGLTVHTIKEGQDSTKKFLIRLHDGLYIESVLMRDTRGRGWTACVSTQVGCPIGCKFCYTGKAGFFRSLKTPEIVGQILSMIRVVPPGERISSVVFMGMGEPLLNYDNVLKALGIFMSEGGLQISPRKITLSTVGIPSAMQRLGRDSGVCLALSLSATTDEVRSSLIPMNKRYPIQMLLKASRSYPHKKMMTIEYVLIKGVNDSLQDARRLIRLLKGIWCKVNLIPYNPIPGGKFNTPSSERVKMFQGILIEARMTAIVRKSKGGDVQGACGQLGGTLLNK